MADRRRAQLDLAELLLAVENAPPVAAADVLGERLAETFGASGVSLLVADLSGRALIRLGHGASDVDARTQGRRFTDLFEWGQRSVPLLLAAEVQHRLLPEAFTCEAGQFTLAAWLDPAGEVAGDTFDFAMERDTLHLSMTDAMGHSIDASILG